MYGNMVGNQDANKPMPVPASRVTNYKQDSLSTNPVPPVRKKSWKGSKTKDGQTDSHSQRPHVASKPKGLVSHHQSPQHMMPNQTHLAHGDNNISANLSNKTVRFYHFFFIRPYPIYHNYF